MTVIRTSSVHFHKSQQLMTKFSTASGLFIHKASCSCMMPGENVFLKTLITSEQPCSPILDFYSNFDLLRLQWFFSIIHPIYFICSIIIHHTRHPTGDCMIYFVTDSLDLSVTSSSLAEISLLRVSPLVEALERFALLFMQSVVGTYQPKTRLYVCSL